MRVEKRAVIGFRRPVFRWHIVDDAGHCIVQLCDHSRWYAGYLRRRQAKEVVSRERKALRLPGVLS